MDLGMEHNIVIRSGAWFRYGEMQLGQGKEKARQFLKENPELTEEIKQKVLAAGGFTDLLTGSPETNSEDSPEEE